jgi:pimeloyl-ACP methyl ester carboxylesterase
MAIYALVHGAGHGGWCYRRVADRLRVAGHEVYTPTLTGLGERAHLLTPEVSLTTHIQDVVAVLEFEDLRNVVLVGHSYGGMVISGVADRAPDRVGHLVFLDAAIPVSGESLADTSPAAERVIRPEARIVDGIELILWPDAPVARALYGVEDEADWAWMLPRLRPHPWRCFEEKLIFKNSQAVAAIPRTIINCPSTLRARARSGEEKLTRYAAGENVWEVDTGHDLMITAPDATTELLLRLAR